MNSSLLKVSVLIAPEAEDAFVERLHALTGVGPSVYTDFETKETRAIVYLEPKKIRLPQLKKQLAGAVALIRESGHDAGPGTVTVEKVKKEDWAESWKRHFQPIEIGDALLIKPSWIKQKPKKGQKVIVLDPGLSFGTGHHATTSFCLEQLAKLRSPDAKKQSLLDVGCGSGILAIGAALYGGRDIDAVDIDEAAVSSTRDNASANGVTLAAGLPDAAQGEYPLVLANILATPLKLLAPLLAGHVAAGGHLVLAGILARQADELKAAYAPFLTLAVTDEEDGWILMTARRG